MNATDQPSIAEPRRDVPATQVAPDLWDLPLRGAFDLGQSIRFGFGQRAAGTAGPLRLAFCLDGTWEQVAVAVTAPAPGILRFAVHGDAEPERIVGQAARILSVDVDASGYDALGGRDPLVRRLQEARPGLRPPLFHSAYEALCWSVLSARRPAAQMAQVRDRLGRAHGRVFELAGTEAVAFPTPDQLLRVQEFEGVPELKLSRLHAVAEAARDGELDTDALRRLDPSVAAARLQRLPGIGPFYAELVTVRTLGHTDVLPSAEVGAAEIAGSLLGRPLDVAGLAEVAAAWTPWRTWVCVALRAAGPLVLTVPGQMTVGSSRNATPS
jgi:DNA-3-methyladenine glycosylase II